jgi:serine/threonine-protein kinase
VAIKTLRPELSRDRSFVDRFYNEAKSLANLNHTNITTLYALHAEGDEAFMVMELVEGQTLEAILARVGRLTLRDSLAIMAQAIPGIRYAHRRGVIHRDIKPANLMLTDEGVVKIMDFGIARVRGSQHLTQVGEFVGTFVYASPEQIRGEEVDERSDLYSLAIVFYRMLAGKAPFTSDNEYALMTAHLQTPPPPLVGQLPDLDDATEKALMRALAKRPEDRFASVEEFGRAIGARALRDDSVDILQQLYARVFDGGDDPEKTRIVTARRYESTAEPTLPSNRGDWRLPDSAALPDVASSRPADAEPWSNGADRQPVAPQRVTVLQPPTPVAGRQAGRRAWLIGAGALALPLLLGAFYYLVTPSAVTPTRVASAPPLAPATERPTAPSTTPLEAKRPPPVEPVKSEIRPPSLPPPVEPATREAQAPTAPPPAVEVAKKEVPAPPPSVETGRSETPPPPPPPAVEAARREVQAPSALPPAVEPVKVQSPPPAVEPAKVHTPPTTVEPVKVQSPPPAVEPTKVQTPPPAVEPTKVETPPPAVEPAKVETPPPAVEPEKSEPQPPPPAPERPAAGTQVATAEPPKPPERPSDLGPAAPPKPEGEPDLQGRVTGIKGLNEIELDKTNWIKIYGIVDRTPQAARHTEALVRYLKPSRNHVVCYKKPSDTYRCYSDGQDIARLALLDRLVQLAPNAPAEYRSLLTQRR